MKVLFITGGIIAFAALLIAIFLPREPESKDEKIYRDALKGSFECPSDLRDCDYVDTSTNTKTVQCPNCKRYKG